MSEKKEKKKSSSKEKKSSLKGETTVRDKRDVKEKVEDEKRGKEERDSVSKVSKKTKKSSSSSSTKKKSKAKEEDENPSPKVEWEFSGEWEAGVSAGGSVDNPTWRDNPQIFLTVLKTGKVEISLTQRSSKNTIGFYVLETDGTGRRIVGSIKKLIMAETPFAKTKEVTKVYSLDADAKPYVIIPATVEPDAAGKFSIRVTSQDKDKPIVVEMNTQRRALSLSLQNGEWKGATAGGCKNHPTFVHNPQYLLDVAENSTRVSLLLLQTAKSKFDDIGMYIAKLDPKEDSGSKLVNSPERILDKSPFSSPKEVSLVQELDTGRYVVIPCTFDAKNEGVFQLRVYSDKNIGVRELGEKKGSSLNSEWKGETAGGCMNHITWRKNPHFALRVNKKSPFTLQLSQKGSKTHVIGFYIITTDNRGNRRTLVNRRKHVVEKSDFLEISEVSKQITLEASSKPYIILPCTFDKGDEAPFTLTLYPSGSPDDVTLEAASDNAKEITHSGEWDEETSGGCKNYYSWPVNPQYLLEADAKSTITLFLTVPEKAEGQYKKSIGMYVNKVSPNKDGKYDRVYDDSTPIVARARFSKQRQVFCKLKAEKGDRFVVSPSMFHAGQKSPYTISAVISSPSSTTGQFTPLPGKPYLIARGAWTEESAGGCINRPSWVHNPHFALTVKRKCKALFVLVQHPELSGKKKKEWDAIGIYVNKGNEWGFPQLQAESDLVGKSDFEKFRDAYVTVTLEPSRNPYIVTPSTFDSGITAKFQILLFAAEQDLKDNLSLSLIDYKKVLDASVDEEPAPQPRAQETTTITTPAQPAVAPAQPAAVAPAQAASSDEYKRKDEEIRKKAGILRQKENELSSRTEEIDSRLAELERRERELKEREERFEEKQASKAKRWKEKKKLHKKQLKDAESKGFKLQKEYLEKEQEAKEARQREKAEEAEREARERAERDERERVEKEEKARKQREAEEEEKKRASDKKELPDKVICPSCSTSFDPLNPETTAEVSLNAILAPAPPPPEAPLPPPPVAPSAPKAPAAPAPPPPMADLPHEEFKIARKTTGDDFLGLLRQGIKLQDAQQRQVKEIPKDDWAVPFNLEKIVARRNALEMSDDEDEEWNDDWS